MNNISSRITKLRTSLKMSQEQFATLFEVTKQSVQKWESGETMPELGKLIQMSKKFNISLDALVVGSSNRTSEGSSIKSIEPPLENLNSYESYSSYIMTEYMQSYEEGKDIEPYKDVFQSISNLPHGKMKEKLCDVLYTIVMNCPQRSDYKYIEPSDLEEIKLLRRPHEVKGHSRQVASRNQDSRRMDGQNMRLHARQNHRGHQDKRAYSLPHRDGQLPHEALYL